MMARVPEPELMDTEAQAAAYAAADFSAPNAAFVDHVARVTAQVSPGRQALTGQALDLGCGPADIPIRLARAYPRLTIDALDGAEHMLAHARQALVAEPPDVAARVRLRSARLPYRACRAGRMTSSSATACCTTCTRRRCSGRPCATPHDPAPPSSSWICCDYLHRAPHEISSSATRLASPKCCRPTSTIRCARRSRQTRFAASWPRRAFRV